MSIRVNTELPLVRLNLHDIERILDLMIKEVTLHDTKKKAKVSIHLNTTEFETIQQAQKFIAHYDATYNSEAKSFGDKLKKFSISVACHDQDVDDYRKRGYRTLDIEVTESSVKTTSYGDSKTSGMWVIQQGEFLDGLIRQYAVTTAPVKALKVVGLSTSGLIIAGGTVAAILVTPLLLPVALVGVAGMFASMQATKGKTQSSITFLPPPARDTGVLVNVAR